MNTIKTTILKLYFILGIVFISSSFFGQNLLRTNFIHTVFIPSENMGLKHKAMVFVPENYIESRDSFPVVYLLHGFTGYYNNWFERDPKIEQYATEYQLIIVTPEGTSDSWYIDGPIDTSRKYQSYIGQEVPNWIDNHYRTKKGKENRAICGLSMGGHGALTIAADYPHMYGAASSMSGALDLRAFSERGNIKSILGDIYKHPSPWFTYSFIGKVYEIDKTNSPNILIDCGKDDMFFNMNNNVHELLNEKGISHKFIIKPGGHSWDYWRNALPEHLDFFQKFFMK